MTRLVLSLAGRDTPGISRDVCAAVARTHPPVSILDMRQTVVRRRLRLAMELLLPGESSALSDGLLFELLRVAKRYALAVDFDLPPDNDAPAPRRIVGHVLTLLCEGDISAGVLRDVAVVLEGRGFCVEKVARLSCMSMRCLELSFSGVVLSREEDGELRADLYRLGDECGVDVALQADSVLRRSKRVVVMDMDSTLIQQEVIDELARYAGVYEDVQAITHAAMSGEIDFNQSLEARCALLKGTPEAVFEKVIENLVYTEGAHELCRVLKKLGYRLAVISGGFLRVAEHVARTLGLDMFYANELEVDADGCFTGKTVGPIVNAQRKADLLVTIAQKEGVTLAQTAAIGDGSNDTLMLGVAGLGIAFNAKPAVQKAASFRINQRNLDSTLYLLGFSEEEQVELASKRNGRT